MVAGRVGVCRKPIP